MAESLPPLTRRNKPRPATPGEAVPSAADAAPKEAPPAPAAAKTPAPAPAPAKTPAPKATPPPPAPAAPAPAPSVVAAPATAPAQPTADAQMLRFLCGFCQHRLKVPASKAGHLCRCPRCRQKVLVPPAPVAAPEPARPLPVPPPPPEPSHKRGWWKHRRDDLHREMVHMEATSSVFHACLRALRNPRDWIHRHPWMGRAMGMCLIVLAAGIVAWPYIEPHVGSARAGRREQMLLDTASMRIARFPASARPTPDTGAQVVYWADGPVPPMRPGMKWTELEGTREGVNRTVLWIYRMKPGKQWEPEYAELADEPRWLSPKSPEFGNWMRHRLYQAKQTCPKGRMVGD